MEIPKRSIKQRNDKQKEISANQRADNKEWLNPDKCIRYCLAETAGCKSVDYSHADPVYPGEINCYTSTHTRSMIPPSDLRYEDGYSFFEKISDDCKGK